MSRIAYVNGTYRPHRVASVHVEDRGYQFADGIYEVVLVCGGRLVDEEPHLDRLDRSLREMRIEPPMARVPLRLVLREVLRRNRLHDGLLYLQVTRGVARRDHPFPDAATPPALVVTAKRLVLPDRETSEKGIGVITIPDIRWERCDIKTIALVPSVLGKQQAREAGAGEAWLGGGDGNGAEGTSPNPWVVAGGGGRRRNRDRGNLHQCLDRDRGRGPGHARHQPRHPCRCNAGACSGDCTDERARIRGAPVYRGGGAVRP